MITATICEEHGAVIPDTVTAYRSHFGGQFVAACHECSVVFAAWECACEWSHDCGAAS
jgi:hypothetical protein